MTSGTTLKGRRVVVTRPGDDAQRLAQRPPSVQQNQKERFGRALRDFHGRVLLRTYSLMGTRGDCDLLLWQAAEELEWRVPLDEAWQRVPTRAIQGNLDPAALFAPSPSFALRSARSSAQSAGVRDTSSSPAMASCRGRRPTQFAGSSTW
jgi:hypothetical protein